MSIPFLFILEMSSLTDKYTLFRMKNVLFSHSAQKVKVGSAFRCKISPDDDLFIPAVLIANIVFFPRVVKISLGRFLVEMFWGRNRCCA